MTFRRGDRVRVERDERRWPSKGTWPKYRGREGTVVAISRSDGEYGVSFNRSHDNITWFALHELVAAGKPSEAAGETAENGAVLRSEPFPAPEGRETVPTAVGEATP